MVSEEDKAAAEKVLKATGPTAATKTLENLFGDNGWKPNVSPVPNGPVDANGIPIAAVSAANSAFTAPAVAPIPAPVASPTPSPIGPPVAPSSIPTALARPPEAPVTPYNVTAPENLNPLPGKSAAPVGGSVVQAPNPLAIPAANPFAGPDGKDARANLIKSKYTDAKAQIQSQLSTLQAGVEEGNPDPNYKNKAAALQVQLHNLDSGMAKDLQTNDAAYSNIWQTGDDGKMHVGNIPKNLSPQDVRKLELSNQRVEQGNQDTDFRKQQDAMRAETDARTAQNDVTTAGLLQIAAQKQQDANDKIQRQQVFQSQLQKKQDEADLAIKNYNDSSIDENRFWSKTPVGNQIGIAILAGLTGAFNGLNHVAGNSVVDRVNSIIANDIDQQKTELAKKGKDVENANNAVAAFQRQGYDLEQSTSMAKAAMMDATISKVQAEASKYNNPMIKAQADQAAAQLAQQRDKDRAAVLTPYINANIQANQAIPAGAGARKGYGAAVKGKDGKYYVPDLAHGGRLVEATGEEVAQATNIHHTQVATDHLGQPKPAKPNFRQTNLLATSSGLPKLTADVKEPYSAGGLNTFSTTDTDAKLNQWAAAISAVTKVPADVIIHNVKNPILNSSSEQIIDHYAKDAETKRDYYEKNPSAVPGAADEPETDTTEQ